MNSTRLLLPKRPISAGDGVDFDVRPGLRGQPAKVRALDDFLTYASQQPGVAYLRKDLVARLRARSGPRNVPIERAKRFFSAEIGRAGARPVLGASTPSSSSGRIQNAVTAPSSISIDTAKGSVQLPVKSRICSLNATGDRMPATAPAGVHQGCWRCPRMRVRCPSSR